METIERSTETVRRRGRREVEVNGTWWLCKQGDAVRAGAFSLMTVMSLDPTYIIRQSTGCGPEGSSQVFVLMPYVAPHVALIQKLK